MIMACGRRHCGSGDARVHAKARAGAAFRIDEEFTADGL
jgi:hypothetical protein